VERFGDMRKYDHDQAKRPEQLHQSLSGPFLCKRSSGAEKERAHRDANSDHNDVHLVNSKQVKLRQYPNKSGDLPIPPSWPLAPAMLLFLFRL
jgi:hypothetical protein